MKNNSDAIKILYESGHYFNEAMSWYKECYLSSTLSRNIYIIISIVLISSIAVSVKLINNLFPMHKTAKIVIQTERRDGSEIRIGQIDKFAHPTLSIAKLLIQNYIQIREGYTYGGIYSISEVQNQIKNVENTSARSVFLVFNQEMKAENGIMSLFQNRINKTINIEKVEYASGTSFFDALMYMVYPGKIPTSAKITYTEEIKGVTCKYLVYVEYNIKIPTKPIEKNVDFIPKKEISSSKNDKISSIKSYITGLDQKFDPHVQFTITGYKKIKISE